MTTYIPAYLRPVSQTRTGNQSKVDQKAEKVSQIKCPGIESLSLKQKNPVDIWINEQAHRGRRVVTSDNKIRKKHTVDHPERHWWIISNGLFETIDPPLREHADIFDFLISLNLCIDEPVFLSQSPGQVVGGAFTYEKDALNYRGDLSAGNFAIALSGLDEIPDEVDVTGDVMSIFESVRYYRSKQVATDDEMDIRIALHMYDDALSSDLWTAAANLYYVCENILFSGKYQERNERDQLIAKNTPLDEEQAGNWRKMVNRIKHTDKGEKVEGLLDREELEVPKLALMRQSANDVLKQWMN
ncbi:hypothetical protein [Halobellus inordinatus]|uniref:hypothetical protein n=1 Tax=Halobellus inordinatus TaxID=1126236 RepID=UPI0021151B73|nr:hypothetical protein [Halobellus ramosii]